MLVHRMVQKAKDSKLLAAVGFKTKDARGLKPGDKVFIKNGGGLLPCVLEEFTGNSMWSVKLLDGKKATVSSMDLIKDPSSGTEDAYMEIKEDGWYVFGYHQDVDGPFTEKEADEQVKAGKGRKTEYLTKGSVATDTKDAQSRAEIKMELDAWRRDLTNLKREEDPDQDEIDDLLYHIKNAEQRLKMTKDDEKIFGYSWEQIKAAQQKKGNLSGSFKGYPNANGDDGADPIGNGKFRMHPSGDIVDFAERNRRLSQDAVNSNGEREFQTYEAWRRACRLINNNVQFEGDKDICQAKPGIGEWDGARGIVYAGTKDAHALPDVVLFTQNGYKVVEEGAHGRVQIIRPNETGPRPSFNNLEDAKRFINREIGATKDAMLEVVERLKDKDGVDCVIKKGKDYTGRTVFYAETAQGGLLGTELTAEGARKVITGDAKTKDSDEKELAPYKSFTIKVREADHPSDDKYIASYKGKVLGESSSLSNLKNWLDKYTEADLKRISGDAKTKDTDTIEFSVLKKLIDDGRIEVESWGRISGNHGTAQVRGANRKLSSLFVENIPQDFLVKNHLNDSKTKDELKINYATRANIAELKKELEDAKNRKNDGDIKFFEAAIKELEQKDFNTKDETPDWIVKQNLRRDIANLRSQIVNATVSKAGGANINSAEVEGLMKQRDALKLKLKAMGDVKVEDISPDLLNMYENKLRDAIDCGDKEEIKNVISELFNIIPTNDVKHVTRPISFKIKDDRLVRAARKMKDALAKMGDNYTITVNKSGQVLTFNVFASSEKAARTAAIAGLEKQMGLNPGSLQNEFDGTKNNITITKDADFKEEEHPRKAGQFVAKGQGGASSSEKGGQKPESKTEEQKSKLKTEEQKPESKSNERQIKKPISPRMAVAQKWIEGSKNPAAMKKLLEYIDSNKSEIHRYSPKNKATGEYLAEEKMSQLAKEAGVSNKEEFIKKVHEAGIKEWNKWGAEGQKKYFEEKKKWNDRPRKGGTWFEKQLRGQKDNKTQDDNRPIIIQVREVKKGETVEEAKKNTPPKEGYEIQYNPYLNTIIYAKIRGIRFDSKDVGISREKYIRTKKEFEEELVEATKKNDMKAVQEAKNGLADNEADWEESVTANKDCANICPLKLEKLRKNLLKTKDAEGEIIINNTPDEEFDAEELVLGVKHEMEHTSDPGAAKSIAKDHLSEDPNYYSKLMKMEAEAKS